MSKKTDNRPKKQDKISDPLVQKFYEWADARGVSKKNEPLVFIAFLLSKEGPLPGRAKAEFFSRPLPSAWRRGGWTQYNASWKEIQNCCVAWSKSMSAQLQCNPDKIDYDYAAMQTLSSDILYAAAILDSQVFKKDDVLKWNCCEWCWRIAINSKRCSIHCDAAASETRKNQRLKRIAAKNNADISKILNSIYCKMPKININKPLSLKDQLVNLPLTTKYLLNKNVDLSDNVAIIDALDEACSDEEKQKREELHKQLANDYRARVLLAKCEFWHEIGAGSRKPGSGGSRPGAGRPRAKK